MSLVERLEKALGRWAIPGLMRYVVGLNALVYFLIVVNPGYEGYLELDREAILAGEVWRIVTWLFLPNTISPLWIIFYLMFSWWLGEMLEGVWGTFRLNVYYFTGAIFATLAVFLLGASGGNYLLMLTLLLALATLEPDREVLLIIIPVKLKWLALFSLVFPWGLFFVFGTMSGRAVVLMCLGNYFLFFAPELVRGFMGRTPISLSKRVKSSHQEALHRCVYCGITELSHPEAEFRVAADGREYCVEHLNVAGAEGGSQTKA